MGDTHGEIYWIGQRGRLGFNIASDGKVTSRWLRQSRICLQCRRPRFDPWVGKIPWRRKWEPTPVFLPGKSQWTEEPAGCSLCGCRESDMTELTTLMEKPKQIFGPTQYLEGSTVCTFLGNQCGILSSKSRKGTQEHRIQLSYLTPEETESQRGVWQCGQLNARDSGF